MSFDIPESTSPESGIALEAECDAAILEAEWRGLVNSPPPSEHQAAPLGIGDEELERMQSKLTANLREERAYRYGGKTVAQLARDAHKTGCVAVVRFDDSLPNKLRVDFEPDHVPEHLRPEIPTSHAADDERPALLRIQV